MMNLEEKEKIHTSRNGIQETSGDQQSCTDMHDDVKKEKKFGICFLFRHDKGYRKKFWQTVWLGWSLFLLGWIFGQTGPCFLDILAITNSDIDEGSAFVTSGFIGYLIGALVGGYLFDRFNRQLLLFFSIFLCALDVAVIPWCYIYETMIVSQSVSGFLQGAWDAMANAHLIFIWGADNGPYMQAIQFAFAVGGMVSPLVTAPFLLPQSIEKESSMFPNTTMVLSSSTYNAVQSMSTEETTINNLYSSPNINYILNTSEMLNETTATFMETQESRLYIAFFITSALCVSSAIPFLLYYFQSQRRNNNVQEEPMDYEENRHISTLLKVLTIINVMAVLGVFGVMESMVVQYLSPFCVTFLNWSKSDGSAIVSLYWVTFGIGRFLGIFLIKYIHFVKIIISFSIFLILDTIGLLFSSLKMFNVGVWLFGSLIGFGLSIVFPVIISWTELEMFPVTGLIAALYLIGGSSLRMLNPLLLGFLMEEISAMYFCYLLLGYSILYLILCIITVFLSKANKKHSKSRMVYKDREIYIAVATDSSNI